MRTILALIIVSVFMFGSSPGFCKSVIDTQPDVQAKNSTSDEIILLSSPELKNLTTSWASEFMKQNPNQKIVIANVNDYSNFYGSAISIVSGNNLAFSANESNWKIALGRNAVVPIINSNNPMLDEIIHKGLSTDEFAKLTTRKEYQNWAKLIQNGQNIPIHFYILNDKGMKACIANFVKLNESEFSGSAIETANELVVTVMKDKYAIGFCKLSEIMDPKTNEVLAGIKIIPIDRNQNGFIDNFENIYSNLAAFNRGVWIGKYPKSLSENIYAVASGKPTDQRILNFLSWMNSGGQQFLNPHGFSTLVSSEKQANMEALIVPQNNPIQRDKSLLSRAWMPVLFFLALATLVIVGIISYRKNKKSEDIDEEIEITSAFNENSIQAPKGLYFDKSHTWAFMESDGNVKIGMDDFMQHVTGLLTRIVMKEPGEKVRKGEKIMTIIQNGKHLDISSPVSGTIIKHNRLLAADSSMINTNPYTSGWVYIIEPKNWLREIQFMFMSEKYKKWLQDEFIRLKDFLAASVKSNREVYSHVILQDGGELTNNVLADFGPEVWEDFQAKFIDTSK